MGLDMYIEVYNKNDSIMSAEPISREHCWRGARHIHNWLKCNAEDVISESCYHLSVTTVMKLLIACQKAQRNPSIAFNYEKVSFDHEYYKNIDSTVTLCSELLRNINFKEELIIYRADW